MKPSSVFRPATLVAGCFAVCSLAAMAEPAVLIYTRNHVTNGTGFVHDNIATSVAAVKELCGEKGIKSESSDDPAVFTKDNLAKFKAVIFCNSNNEAFATPEQSKAFTEYVENGGGFVGIHSASGSERKNPDFKRILGGTFKWHTPNQKFSVVVADPKHPSAEGIPATWTWKDEGYLCDLVPGLHVILEMDTTSVATPPREKWALKFEGNRFPLAWCHEVGKGRSFYTALGHDIASYADPHFRKHIQGGILWTLGMAK
ncbi:MAG: ThuA domain-containing protein [Verrucomicrobia bacterium]|nr:ThuA domain-containing protein [Verrucomicrobiota bacterium]